MAIHLGRPLLDASRDQPECSALRRACPDLRPDVALLFGLAPGGVCRAAPVASRAVRSYRPVSPLPARRQAVCFLWHFPWGRPRRVLPGTVSPWSPDFPPCRRKPGQSSHLALWRRRIARGGRGSRQRCPCRRDPCGPMTHRICLWMEVEHRGNEVTAGGQTEGPKVQDCLDFTRTRRILQIDAPQVPLRLTSHAIP